MEVVPPQNLRYAPECVEVEFCELRPNGVLRSYKPLMHLGAVMNSIRNGLGMRKTEIAKEPSRPWNPHFYAIYAQVHSTLYASSRTSSRELAILESGRD